MDHNCSTIILSIDGLRAAALGTYGETNYETPGFDRLASEAITFDWCYADTDQTEINLEKLIDGLASHGLCRNASFFATDDEGLIQDSSFNQFQESFLLETSSVESVAESTGKTHFATAITRFGEKLAEWSEQAVENERTCNAWLHLKGFSTPWDAPQELCDLLLDEEDEPLTPSIEPAQLSSSEVDESVWCEARFHASCRYSAQVMVLDACLEGLLDFLEDLFEGQNYQFVLLGTSGYSLGEHGEIGGKNCRLYSEQQHVPLLWKTPDPNDRFSRSQQLTLLSNFFASNESSDLNQANNPLLLSSENGSQAVRTDSWYLIKPNIEDPCASDLELYLKPDDRWEQNDVCKLEIATAEKLLALMRKVSEK